MKKIFLLCFSTLLLCSWGCVNKKAVIKDKPTPAEVKVQRSSQAPTESRRALRKEERRRQKVQGIFYNR